MYFDYVMTERERNIQANLAVLTDEEKEALKTVCGGGARPVWGRAVPCRAVLCRAVPCRAVPCRAVPCRAVPCLVVPVVRRGGVARLTFCGVPKRWPVRGSDTALSLPPPARW